MWRSRGRCNGYIKAFPNPLTGTGNGRKQDRPEEFLRPVCVLTRTRKFECGPALEMTPEVDT